MLHEAVIALLSAFLLGTAYALLTWILCRKRLGRREWALIAAGLTGLHHAIAGIMEILFGDTLLSLVFFYTIKVPWSYGFGIGPKAFWLVLLIQAIVSAVISAGICTILPLKRKGN